MYPIAGCNSRYRRSSASQKHTPNPIFRCELLGGFAATQLRSLKGHPALLSFRHSFICGSKCHVVVQRRLGGAPANDARMSVLNKLDA